MRCLTFGCGLLLSALCWGCADEGGSTGQEHQISYEPEDNPCSDPHDEGPTQDEVDAFVELIEGTYATTLYWVDREIHLPVPPELVEDVPATPMTIELRYAGTEVASRGCTGIPTLPFVVRMTTEDGTLDWEFLGASSLAGPDFCFYSVQSVEFTTEDPGSANEQSAYAGLVQVASPEDLTLPRGDDPDGPLGSVDDLVPPSSFCFGPSDRATRGEVFLRSGEHGVWPEACGGVETQPANVAFEGLLPPAGMYETTGEHAGLLRLSLASTGDELACISPESGSPIASQPVTIELGADSWTGLAQVSMGAFDHSSFGSVPCFEAADAEGLTGLLAAEARSVCAAGYSQENCEWLLELLDTGTPGSTTCISWTYSGQTMTVDVLFEWHVSDGNVPPLTVRTTAERVSAP